MMTRALAVLLIPAIGLSATITASAFVRDSSGLGMHTIPDSGVGWLTGSAWIYDAGGRVALGAHAALADGDPGAFYRLGDVQPGDMVIVVGDQGAVRYQVTQIVTTSRWDIRWMKRGAGVSTLALITCTADPDTRFVVIARQVD